MARQWRGGVGAHPHAYIVPKWNVHILYTEGVAGAAPGAQTLLRGGIHCPSPRGGGSSGSATVDGPALVEPMPIS